MFRKNLLLLSMNFVLQTKKSELTRSKLILTLQNGILSCNSATENIERDYYEKYLHIGKQFLFAASLDEARLMAMGGRGYIAVESVASSATPPLTRLEVRRPDGSRIERTYCAFWYKNRTNYYIEEFASILRRQYSSVG